MSVEDKTDQDVIVRYRNIKKAFGDTVVLNELNIDVKKRRENCFNWSLRLWENNDYSNVNDPRATDRRYD